MMKARRNASLKAYNTFGIDAKAAFFVEAASRSELEATLNWWTGSPPFILGGGSNLLLAGDIDGLVIKNNIRGKAVLSQDEKYALVAAGAGENWHDFVRWCLARGLGGIENLSLIPGTVGAAPIQNIGAYGVELKDVFHSLEAVELVSGKMHTFHKEECRFAYRDSIFKRELKGKWCITRVMLKLTRSSHRLNTSYGAIRETLDKLGVLHPEPKDISQAVVLIRSSKLPDPAILGNAGSFFKNPEIPLSQLEKLKEQHPDIVYYTLGEGMAKVPAGWLIERAGWKGRRFGDAGCYDKQALVLVNYGNASGDELYALAKRISASVSAMFGIKLEPEVNVIGA